MTQLPLLDVASSQIENPGPDLDTATIRRLKAIEVVYQGTHWGAYWREWQHWIELRSERGIVRRLVKNDQGIAAMLRDRGA